MNKKQVTNKCYVFSQSTFDQALTEWIQIESNKDAKNEESYLITAKAFPWFLNHLNQSSSIYMFSQDDLLVELEAWKLLQVTDFPKQKKRIEKTCDLITNFFQSDSVIQHKMAIEA